MTKDKPQRTISAEAKEALYGSVCCDSIATTKEEAYVKGYHQAIEDACEWIKQQQEMLEDCFSDAGDFADLLKQAMEE